MTERHSMTADSERRDAWCQLSHRMISSPTTDGAHGDPDGQHDSAG